MNKTKCKICGKEIGNKGLTSHLKTHNITSKQYYDTYLKKDGEGICLECGKETKFIKFTKGYHSFCSTKCSNNNKDVFKFKKESCIKKYGVDNPAKAEVVKDKIKQTNLERYGAECTLASEIIKEKIKETNLERYNAETWRKSKIGREKLREITGSKEFKQKCYDTKKKNHTFNVSKIEKELEIELQKLFPDLLTQYKSELYPFNCDFYVPSLDLYIEYNGTWTHGEHFFNKNNQEDLNKLKKWENKNTKYYNNAIETWTVRDLNKLNTALKNNLNYVAWFNQEQAYDWINAYKKSRTLISSTLLFSFL